MRAIVILIFAVTTSFIAAGTAYQFYVLLWKPELSIIRKSQYQRMPIWKRFWIYASIGAAFLGVGYMIYKGIEGAFWFIPKSWRTVNDDGESEWIVHGVAFLVAFIGSVFGLSKLSDIAAERAKNIQKDNY